MCKYENRLRINSEETNRKFYKKVTGKSPITYKTSIPVTEDRRFSHLIFYCRHVILYKCRSVFIKFSTFPF